MPKDVLLSQLPRRRTWIPLREILRMFDEKWADPGLLRQLNEAMPDTVDEL